MTCFPYYMPSWIFAAIEHRILAAGSVFDQSVVHARSVYTTLAHPHTVRFSRNEYCLPPCVRLCMSDCQSITLPVIHLRSKPTIHKINPFYAHIVWDFPLPPDGTWRLTEGTGLIGLGLTGGAGLDGEDGKEEFADRGLGRRWSWTISGGVRALAKVVFRRLMFSWLNPEEMEVGPGLELQTAEQR